jgi:hypothetical protein
MSIERRENDKIILDRLEKLQSDATDTKINLALNTQATKGIEDHLAQINGKVASHNASILALQAQATVASTFITETNEAKKEHYKNRSSNLNRVYWLMAGLGLGFVGRVLTYLLQTDFFKHIYQ